MPQCHLASYQMQACSTWGLAIKNVFKESVGLAAETSADECTEKKVTASQRSSSLMSFPPEEFPLFRSFLEVCLRFFYKILRVYKLRNCHPREE